MDTAENISAAADAKAADIDKLRSWDRSEYEEAWQGVEAWVDKNGVRIDALDEVRGYIDNILEARLDARQEAEFNPFVDDARSPLDHAQTQADGFTSLVNIGLVSSVLIAEHLKKRLN